MGKSSILRQINYLCKFHDKWAGYHPVFIDAMGGGGSIALNLMYEFDINRSYIRDAWFLITKHLRRTTGKTLLLIDECNYWIEVQTQSKKKSRKEFAALRALHQSGDINIVASTLYGSLVDHLEQLEELSSPFYNIFHTFRLPSFTPDEAIELVVTLCERGGIKLDYEFAAELTHYVGYYPNLVQEMGHLAFINRIEGKSDGIEVIAEEWRNYNGYNWLPIILAPFKKDYIGAVARLAGVERNEFLINSFEAYGILMRKEDGSLAVAPYIKDLLNSGWHKSELEIGIEELEALSSCAISKKNNLAKVVEKALRLAFRENPPSLEKEVQHYVDVILCAAGYNFVREGPTFVFSLKGYRPDYSSELQNLAIEVKLCRGTNDVKRVVDEMSADIMPYLKKFGSILFIVFDLGGIYNVEQFRSDFETNPKVSIVVVKR